MYPVIHFETPVRPTISNVGLIRSGIMMISEFGNYKTRVDLDGRAETADATREAVLAGELEDTSVVEVTIGSLLFESPTIYASLPRRRFRVRSSTVI